ncbi:MAG: zinc ribbon domain-containing protein [Simkaniaceae bacterium]|nr:zinc ribbon domain-containing protein [Simkaniaceae bacterium]
MFGQNQVLIGLSQIKDGLKCKRQRKCKFEWLGGVYVEVNPSYSSQKCLFCGSIDEKNRDKKKQSKFCCIRCGYTENADIKAAKNILAAGRAMLACARGCISNL